MNKILPDKFCKNKIFIISGPSGVGKGTVVNGLLNNPHLNLRWAKSYTTRTERPSDKNEGHYIFIDENKFKILEKESEILESNFYDNKWYGSSKSEIDKALATGHNVIKEVEINGAMKYKNIYPEGILIFIKSDINDIEQRLIERGQNTPEQIEERLNTAQVELKCEKDYNYSVVNPEGHPELAIKEVENIIENELKKN